MGTAHTSKNTKPKGKAKKGSKTSVDAERGQTVFKLPPDAFRVIGRDICTILGRPHLEGEHVLWEDRALLPVDEAFAQAMAHEGFSSVIKVRKNGPFLDIVEGRRRTVAARRANEIRADLGMDPLMVSFVIAKGTDLDMFGHMLSENANRLDLTDLDIAKKAAKFIDMGASEERAARAAGKTVQQLRGLVALLDLDPLVLDALKEGSISTSAAQELLPVAREQQVEQLCSMLDQKVKPTAAAVKSRVKAIQSGNADDAFTAPGKKLIAKVLGDEGIMEVFDANAIKAIRWVLGDLNPRQVKGLSALIAKHAPKQEAK